jgi:hypothetical protein
MKKNLLLFFALFVVFGVSAQVPTILSFSPQTATFGDMIVITGTNFSATPSDNLVSFGKVRGTVTASTATTLTVTVPESATFDYISISVGGKTCYSLKQFNPVFACGALTLDTTSFIRPASKYFAKTGATCQGSVVGDIDGDGKQDLIIAQFADSNLVIFRNTGEPGTLDSNSFQKILFKLPFKSVFQINMGDLNADGKPEIIVGCFSADTFAVIQNNSTPGNISLTVAATGGFVAGSSACAIKVADLDEDGMSEIIIVNRNKRVSIFKNGNTGGNITSANFVRTDILVGTSATMNDMAIGDMNQDGKPDIIVPEYGAAKLHVYINGGNLSFADNLFTTAFNGIWGISVADFDGDGKLDIAGSHRNNNVTFVYPNTTTGATPTLGTAFTYTTTGVQFIYCVASDLNGDGKPDLVFANLATNGNAYIYQNTSTVGSMSFATPFHLKQLTGAINATVSDIDQDGFPDIFLPDNSNGGYSFRNANGTRVRPISIDTAHGVSSVNMQYKVLGGTPLEYSIDWDAAAQSAGFSNLPFAALVSSPIPLTVPVTAQAGVYHGTMTVKNATCTADPRPFTITLSQPNDTPSFIGGDVQTLLVCANSDSVSIDSLLAVKDLNANQTLSWSIGSNALHGTVSGTYTITSTGDTLYPAGLNYKPTLGYTGNDTFTVVVSDGFVTDSTNIIVTVDAPAISISDPIYVCNGSTSISIPYSVTTGSPLSYSIWWISDAAGAGFLDVNDQVLSSDSINIIIPAGVPSESFSGVLYVKNANGCRSLGSTFSIAINPPLQGDTIIEDDTLNVGQAPAAFNSVTVPTGGSGSYSFVWQDSTANGSWNDAFGTNNQATYHASAINQTTFFRRKVTDNTCGSVIYDNMYIGFIPNTPPSVPVDNDAAANTVEENVSNGTTVGITAFSIDQESSSVKYSLTDNAGGRFVVDSITGVVKVADGSLLNYETNTSYNITVSVSDSILTASQTFLINITNVNEAPAITSNGGGALASINISENDTTVSTVTAADEDAGAVLVYSIVSGADQSFFSINQTTGALKFMNAPNFENPLDSGANNTYVVKVRVSDGAFTADQTITATINNLNEHPSFVAGTLDTFEICENAAAKPISSFFKVNDNDINQTLTWSVASLPAHGTLGGFSANGTSNGGDVNATGMTYVSTNGYHGVDSFVVSISDGSASAQIKMKVIVNQLPSVDAGTNVQLCSGASTLLKGSGASSYLWNSGVLDSVIFTPASTLTYTVTGTDLKGCTNTDQVTVTVNPNPVAGFTINDDTQCENNNSFTFSDTSYISSGTHTTKWSYGSNTSTSNILTTTFVSVGSNPIKLLSISDKGCKDSVTKSVTVQAKPSATAIAASATTFCEGGSVAINANTGSGLTYGWLKNNAVIPLQTGATYTAATQGNYRVIVTNSNLCSDTSGVVAVTVNINSSATAAAAGATTFCNGGNVIINANTGSGLSYQWLNNNSPVNLATSSSYLAVTSGNYSVIVTDANTCRDTSTGVTVTVNTNPVATAAAAGAATFCDGGNVMINAPAGFTYQWLHNGSVIGSETSGSYSASVTGDYSVIITDLNSCRDTSVDVSVTVNELPEVFTVTGGGSFCAGGTGVAIGLDNSENGINYQLFNGTSAAGTPVAGTGFSISFGNQTVSGTYTIEATNGTTLCGPVTMTGNAMVSVDPLPVAYTVTGGGSYCAGGTGVAIQLSNSETGVNYQLYKGTSAVGGIVGGSGGLISFGNHTSAGNYTVQAVNATTSCGPVSMTGSLDVSIDPLPLTFNITGGGAYCAGGSGVAIGLDNSEIGVDYQLFQGSSAVGSVVTGTGTAISFGNQTTAGIYTIKATNNTTSCGPVVMTGNVTVSINPIPDATAPLSQILCNNATSTEVVFSGSVNGTVFNWSNDQISIGLTASGSGTIAPFGAVNTIAAPVISTITVTPSANNCIGSSQTFTITVNPTPDVNTVSDQVICNSASTSVIAFTGAVSGTTYSWINDLPSIGLATSGTGDIAAFAVLNTTTAPVIAQITVTPVANNCSGTSKNILITANPTPDVAAPSNQTICDGSATAVITFNSAVSGTTYSWTNDQPSIGLAASGSGEITSFNGVNAGTAPVTATITVAPTANGCAGTARSFTITVNPTVVLSSSHTPAAVCNNTVFDYTPASLTAGTIFAWKRDTVTGISNPAANGTNDPAEQLLNTTVHPVTVIYTYTLTANNCSNTQNVSVVVNPSPALSSASTATICSGTAFDYTPLSATAVTSFGWTRAAVTGITPATGNGTGAIAETLVNGTLNAVNVVYVYTLEAFGCSNTQQVTLTVDPAPLAPVILLKSAAELCSNTQFVNFGAASGEPAGVNYTWSANNANIWATGSDQQYAIVNFPTAGASVVTLTANVPGFACASKDSFTVQVGTGVSATIAVRYFNKHFVCMENTVSSYQWGYDDATTLAPTILDGEINQNYFNAQPDATKLYWVLVSKDGCMQKAYFKSPTGVSQAQHEIVYINAYPNPASDLVEVETSGTHGGEVAVEIIDMLGKTYGTYNTTAGKAQINVSGLTAGIYFLNCFHDGVSIGTKRFVKN